MLYTTYTIQYDTINHKYAYCILYLIYTYNWYKPRPGVYQPMMNWWFGLLFLGSWACTTAIYTVIRAQGIPNCWRPNHQSIAVVECFLTQGWQICGPAMV